MKTLKITQEQQQIIIDSLRDRIGKLYKMSEAYRDGGNKEAQMDCFDEKRKVQKVLDIIAQL